MMAHLRPNSDFADVGGTLGHQREQRDLALFGRGQKKLLIERGRHRNPENRSGRSTQAFRIVGADGALQKRHSGGAEGLRRAQNRSGIARILQSVQNHGERMAAEQLIDAPLAEAAPTPLRPGSLRLPKRRERYRPASTWMRVFFSPRTWLSTAARTDSAANTAGISQSLRNASSSK